MIVNRFTSIRPTITTYLNERGSLAKLLSGIDHPAHGLFVVGMGPYIPGSTGHGPGTVGLTGYFDCRLRWNAWDSTFVTVAFLRDLELLQRWAAASTRRRGAGNMRTCGSPHESFTFMIEYVDGGYISQHSRWGTIYESASFSPPFSLDAVSWYGHGFYEVRTPPFST